MVLETSTRRILTAHLSHFRTDTSTGPQDFCMPAINYSRIAQAESVHPRDCREYSVEKYSSRRWLFGHEDPRGPGAECEEASAGTRLVAGRVGASRENRSHLCQLDRKMPLFGWRGRGGPACTGSWGRSVGSAHASRSGRQEGTKFVLLRKVNSLRGLFGSIGLLAYPSCMSVLSASSREILVPVGLVERRLDLIGGRDRYPV